MTVRTRFAPSPTGYLHLGGLRTALYTYLFTKKNNGVFILRIEDTDQERLVQGATEKIYKSLKLAGLNWDEGPDVGGPVGPYIQSERKDMYLPYAQQLVREGKAYYCFCTKEELAERRAAAEADGDLAVDVASAGGALIFKQRLLRRGAGDFLVSGNRHEAAARRGRLIELDSHP